MKARTFSIVVGNAGCNAHCPWCISRMTETNFELTRDINWRRFATACNIVQQARDGLLSVLLTGKGEPTLHVTQVYQYLRELQNHGNFPLIDLQTNGVLFDPENEDCLLQSLCEWRDLGLTLVCFSVTHYYHDLSNRLMGIRENYDFRRAIKAVHECGLGVRLNFTLLTNGVHTPEHLEHCVDLAAGYGVEQLTFREVTRPCDSISKDHAAYVDAHKPIDACKTLFHYLEMNGANRLPDLAHGAALFDYRGQNVSVNHCLTDTVDPNDIRQIIFFPGGEICYDWKYRGARLL
jgi:molybdenum cofactor biosynthesis enzyme MoaA